jgi:hypothetical protein
MRSMYTYIHIYIYYGIYTYTYTHKKVYMVVTITLDRPLHTAVTLSPFKQVCERVLRTPNVHGVMMVSMSGIRVGLGDKSVRDKAVRGRV